MQMRLIQMNFLVPQNVFFKKKKNTKRHFILYYYMI